MTKLAADRAWSLFETELDRDTAATIDRVRDMAAHGLVTQEKHLLGLHPQSRHTPKKYRKGRGALTPPENTAEFVDEDTLRLFGGEITHEYDAVNAVRDRMAFRQAAAEEIAARTDLDKKTAAELIRIWDDKMVAGDSPDAGLLGLKRGAAEEFGLELPGWMEEKEAKVKELDPNTTYDAVDKVRYEQGVKDGRKAARAMYDITQEKLEAEGIDKVTVYRGFVSSSVVGAEQGDIVGVQGSSVESWSADPDTAKIFASGMVHRHKPDTAGVVLQTEVPAERVLSYYGTGYGLKLEYEITVLEDPKAQDAARVVRYYQ